MNNGRLAFFNLVKKMRAAQKEYFCTRAHSALVRSKDLERRVDDELERVRSKDLERRVDDELERVRSKDLERRVDDELERGDQYLKQQQQPSLFPDNK